MHRMHVQWINNCLQYSSFDQAGDDQDDLVCLAVCVACTQENHMLDNQVDHVQPQHAIRQQWPTGKHVVEETCTALLWQSNPTQQRHELQVHDVFMIMQILLSTWSPGDQEILRSIACSRACMQAS